MPTTTRKTMTKYSMMRGIRKIENMKRALDITNTKGVTNFEIWKEFQLLKLL